ncbi:MAG: hypothetical protein A3D92_20980 [Bacteroidetes bacterium RIFCSPHIGHO2_02_FULL_44_7]|nr:MAG: hypothetical protein A3D92_20980 [Bacteroidetes bacterium RIFCSPHIGHO2_02_FULL_44_7]
MRLLILSFFFLQGHLFAQDAAGHSQIDKWGLPLDVQQDIDNSWRDERTWALKLSPFHLAVGDLALYYEQRVGKHTSIEFGAGATISGVKGILQPAQPVIQPYYDYILPYEWPYQHVSDAGFLGAFEFRIYPIATTNSMRSLYIAPAVKYKRYNYGIRDYSGLLPNYKGNDQHYNSYLNCGFQFWPNRRCVIDVFLGAGLGYHTTAGAIQEYNYVNGNYEGYWRKTTSDELVFLLNTGVKLGIGGGHSTKKKEVVAD